jgi:hypothetical protein
MFQFESLTKRDWALVLVFTVALTLILVGAFYWAFYRAYSVGPPTKAAWLTPMGNREPRSVAALGQVCQYCAPGQTRNVRVPQVEAQFVFRTLAAPRRSSVARASP